MTRWPVLTEHYNDELGGIAPDVHAAAAHVWPRAERFATQTLRDSAEGMTLLMHAAALVSRHRAEGGMIGNLRSYLYRTFWRLTAARLKEAKRHRELEESNQERLLHLPTRRTANLETQILIEQLRQRMDAWTREVFDLRVLGHSFDEIGEKFGVHGGTVRDRFRNNVKQLRDVLSIGNDQIP